MSHFIYLQNAADPSATCRRCSGCPDSDGDGLFLHLMLIVLKSNLSEQYLIIDIYWWRQNRSFKGRIPNVSLLPPPNCHRHPHCNLTRTRFQLQATDHQPQPISILPPRLHPGNISTSTIHIRSIMAILKVTELIIIGLLAGGQLFLVLKVFKYPLNITERWKGVNWTEGKGTVGFSDTQRPQNCLGKHLVLMEMCDDGQVNAEIWQSRGVGDEGHGL